VDFPLPVVPTTITKPFGNSARVFTDGGSLSSSTVGILSDRRRSAMLMPSSPLYIFTLIRLPRHSNEVSISEEIPPFSIFSNASVHLGRYFFTNPFISSKLIVVLFPTVIILPRFRTDGILNCVICISEQLFLIA